MAIQPLGSGNINDTYLAVFRNTFTETQVVLQRVNGSVFSRPDVVMSNMNIVTQHCHRKLERDAANGRDDRVWQMPRIVKAKDGAEFTTDESGNVWRVITRILSAHAFETPQNPEHAMGRGAVLGHFHYLVSDMSMDGLADPLPVVGISRSGTQDRI